MYYDQIHQLLLRPPCHEDCWYYDVFGGVEGCGQRHKGWGGWPEEIKPGEDCLYPSKRDVCKPVLVVSNIGLCAALEGAVIKGSPNDNTAFVEALLD